MKNIIDLPVGILHPHPHNPRKDLGDLTELAESIKQSGVMQNLTVVPHVEISGEYTVIIGHRRLGASKLAGLETVPCVIVEMSEREQLATMMLENMQRSDLTTLEQAEGFQMMIDLGESVESVSEKTGLSKSTVRNRLKLTRYDRQIMKDAAVRQPTMEQYMKLCEIEDVDIANNVARFLGTKNFDNEVQKALRQQREVKERAAAIEIFAKYAEKLDDTSYTAIQEKNLVSVSSFYPPFGEDLEKKITAALNLDVKYYYGAGMGFTIYRKRDESDDAKVEEARAKRRAIDEFDQKAKDLFNAMDERAEEFVKAYRGRAKDRDILNKALFEAITLGFFATSRTSVYGIARALGWKVPDDYESWNDKHVGDASDFIWAAYDENETLCLLNLLWYGMYNKDVCYRPYNSKKLEIYAQNGWMFRLALLTDLGYNVSDEEWAYVNGTHPIYSEEVEG